MDSSFPAQYGACDGCIFFLGVSWRAERQIVRCRLFGDASVNALRGCGAREPAGAPEQRKIGMSSRNASARGDEVEGRGE